MNWLQFFSTNLKADFNTEKPISDEGVYNPRNKIDDFFPVSDVKVIEQCYIADYPDWVRLIIAQGNLFEVMNNVLPVHLEMILLEPVQQ